MTHTPDLRDRVPQGAGTYAINSAIEAGLPNIVGTLPAPQGSSRYLSGPFYCITTVNSSMSEPYGSGDELWGFDASRYNSIYSNDCSTVQPPALAVNFYIKAK